jgi:hypothetical protein
MYLQPLLLTTVSKVSHITGKAGRFTEFGFSSSYATVSQARAFGHLSPTANTEITLAMPGQDRWRHIYGWLDHSSKNVLVPYFWERLVVLLFVSALSFVLIPFFLVGAWSMRQSSWLYPFAFSVGALLVGFIWVSVVRDFLVAQAARKALAGLAASLRASKNAA